MSGGSHAMPSELPIVRYRFDTYPQDVYVGIVDGFNLTLDRTPPSETLLSRLNSLAAQLLLMRTARGVGQERTQGDLFEMLGGDCSRRTYIANDSQKLNLSGAAGFATIDTTATGDISVLEMAIRDVGPEATPGRYKAVAGSILWTLLNDAAREGGDLSGRTISIASKGPSAYGRRLMRACGLRWVGRGYVGDAGKVYATLQTELEALDFRGLPVSPNALDN